jgi:hypothetical protein
MAPTTADIIASARYLDDDFDPSSLTIPNLNGILNHHGVRFTSNARKPALVKLFEDEIVGNLAQLRRERNIIDGSIASGRGITDGLTGLQVAAPDASLTYSTVHVISIVSLMNHVGCIAHSSVATHTSFPKARLGRAIFAGSSCMLASQCIILRWPT